MVSVVDVLSKIIVRDWKSSDSSLRGASKLHAAPLSKIVV